MDFDQWRQSKAAHANFKNEEKEEYKGKRRKKTIFVEMVQVSDDDTADDYNYECVTREMRDQKTHITPKITDMNEMDAMTMTTNNGTHNYDCHKRTYLRRIQEKIFFI